MAITIKCTPAMLGWLKQAFPQTTDMSVFYQFEQCPISEQDKASMIEQKIIDEQGIIRPDMYAMLSILAKADTAFRVQLIKLGNVSEKTVVFAQGQGVSIDQQSGVYTLRFPIPLQQSLTDYREFIGDGRYIDVPFHQVGDSDAIKAAISALDCQRKAVLTGLGTESAFRLNFSKEEIESQCTSNQALAIGSWLSVFEGKPSLKKALSWGYLTEDPKGISLSEAWQTLSNSCLLLDLVVDLLLVKQIDDQNQVSRARAFIFNRHSILYIEENRAMMEVSSVSGQDLIEIIKNLLEGK
jgi:hypothetical protein